MTSMSTAMSSCSEVHPLDCFKRALNFPVAVTNGRGNPSLNERSGCVLFAPAVNVSAPLTECTETEITVGQHAVRTHRERPSDLDSSHTSSTAGPPADSGPLRSALCYSGSMVSDDKKVMFFGNYPHLDTHSTWTSHTRRRAMTRTSTVLISQLMSTCCVTGNHNLC